MISFKVITERSGIVGGFLDSIKANSNNIEGAGRVFQNFSYSLNNTGRNEYQSELNFEHIMPSFIWGYGILLVALALIFGKLWLLIPAGLFFLFRLIDTPLFFYLIFRLGLRRKGYKGKIKLLEVYRE